MAKGNFGSAEFKIIQTPTEIKLVIHGKVIARAKAGHVYDKLFDICKNAIENANWQSKSQWSF